MAAELGIDYIDTGAMYRAIGYKMKLEGIEDGGDARFVQVLDDTDIDFADGNIILDGEDVYKRQLRYRVLWMKQPLTRSLIKGLLSRMVML